MNDRKYDFVPSHEKNEFVLNFFLKKTSFKPGSGGVERQRDVTDRRTDDIFYMC